LLGIAWILTVVIGIPKIAGCVLGGLVITAYFAAGGLKSSAVVNVVQLTVKLAGFAIALPLVLAAVGGLDGLHAAIPEPGMWNPWRNGSSGWIYVAMLAPNFIVSPGLLQKVFGARDDRAVRMGVGLNAVCLLAYAVVPVLLGMSARVLHPGLANADRDMALPLLFLNDLPFWAGALGLAAVFSAEVSAADALLFMLATSLSQDLYKRFVNPAASDQQVVTIARLASVSGAAAAVMVAMSSKSVVDALGIFYTLVGVSLFVPIVAGLYLRRPGPFDALAAIAGGVMMALAMKAQNAVMPLGVISLYGLAGALAAFGLAIVLIRRRE
jgi:SSS family solute:Na+ symporter